MKFLLFLFIAIAVYFIIITSIRKEKKRIYALDLSVNQDLDEERLHFLHKIERRLHSNYSIIVLQDDINFKEEKVFFPKKYAYVHLSKFNELFEIYSLYKKEKISREEYHSSLHFFINTKLFFVSRN